MNFAQKYINFWNRKIIIGKKCGSWEMGDLVDILVVYDSVVLFVLRHVQLTVWL